MSTLNEEQDSQHEANNPSPLVDENLSLHPQAETVTETEIQAESDDCNDTALTQSLGTLAQAIEDSGKNISDGMEEAMSLVADQLETMAEEIQSASERIADSLKEAAAVPMPMKMFPGDQVITGVLSLMSIVTFGLGIIIYTSNVTCAVPDVDYYMSDPMSIFINSYCSEKHAFGGEFTFWVAAETFLIGFPLVIFYQVWGGPELNRHVEQITPIVQSLTETTNETILEDAKNIMKGELEKSQSYFEDAAKMSRSRPSTISNYRHDTTLSTDSESLIRDWDPYLYDSTTQMARGTETQTLDSLIGQDSSRFYFNRAIAIVGFGQYQRWDEQRKQWSFAFHISILFQILVTGSAAIIWYLRLHFNDHFEFSWSSANSFECTDIPTTLSRGLLTQTVTCVYPPRKLFFVVWFINIILLAFMFVVSITRFPWREGLKLIGYGCCCRCWCKSALLLEKESSRFSKLIPSIEQFPNDTDLLFEACEMAYPDIMRIKTFAVYKRGIQKVEDKIAEKRQLRAIHQLEVAPEKSGWFMEKMRGIVKVEKLISMVKQMGTSQATNSIANHQLARTTSTGTVQTNNQTDNKQTEANNNENSLSQSNDSTSDSFSSMTIQSIGTMSSSSRTPKKAHRNNSKIKFTRRVGDLSSQSNQFPIQNSSSPSLISESPTMNVPAPPAAPPAIPAPDSESEDQFDISLDGAERLFDYMKSLWPYKADGWLIDRLERNNRLVDFALLTGDSGLSTGYYGHNDSEIQRRYDALKCEAKKKLDNDIQLWREGLKKKLDQMSESESIAFALHDKVANEFSAKRKKQINKIEKLINGLRKRKHSSQTTLE